MLRGVAVTVAVAALLFVAGCSSHSDGSGGANEAPDGFPACPQAVEPGLTQSASPPPASGDSSSRRLLPDLSLRCMDGSSALFPLRRDVGVPMVINLWGSWCAPCGKELPAFVALDRAAGSRLVVMGVVTEDSATRAKEAALELDVEFPNVYDRSGELRRALGVNALPVTLFVTATGELRELYAGPVLDVDALRQKVSRQLGVELGAQR